MPFWLIVAAIGAYAIYKHAHTTATSTLTAKGSAQGAGKTISITAYDGIAYNFATDPTLDQDTLNQIKQFFATSGHTDLDASNMAGQLVAKNYPIATQSFQNVWGQVSANEQLKQQMVTATGQ
jgi:hypothetical protein